MYLDQIVNVQRERQIRKNGGYFLGGGGDALVVIHHILVVSFNAFFADSK